jgi:hypothetical protein
MTSYKHDLQSGGRKKKRTGKSMKSKKQKSNRKTYKKIKKGGHTPANEEKHRKRIEDLINEFKNNSATESIDDLKNRISILIPLIRSYHNLYAYDIATTKINDQLYVDHNEYRIDHSKGFFENYNDKSSLNELLSKLKSDFYIAVEYYQNKNKPVPAETVYNDNGNDLQTPLLPKNNNETPKKSPSIFPNMFKF